MTATIIPIASPATIDAQRYLVEWSRVVIRREDATDADIAEAVRFLKSWGDVLDFQTATLLEKTA